MPATARILVVCTGNVCRSPMTERLLRAGIDRAWSGSADDVEVRSAGTRAIVGWPMTDEIAAHVRRHGGATHQFGARQLSVEMLAQADLVLALSRAHRSTIVDLHPPALRVTFTLRELARATQALHVEDLLGATAAERVRSLAVVGAALRGTVPPPPSPEDDDVVDPYQQDAARYALTAGQIVPAVNGIVRLLAPVVRTTADPVRA